MKNKLGLIIGVLLAMGLGFVIWAQRSVPLEQVLPSHPLFFARLDHVEEHISQVIHSDFGKNIASIDMPDVLNRNNFSQADINDFQSWQKHIARFWNNPLTKKFLSRQMAVGIYYDHGSYKIFITLRLTLSTRIAELLGQLVPHWGEDITVTKESYHGRTINHLMFKRQNLALAYVRIRDLLILTPDSLGNLDQVVDTYQQHHEPLAVDPGFNFVKQNAYPKADGLGFVNFNFFSHLWRGEMDPRLTNLGLETSAFPIYGLSYRPGVISKYKIIVDLDQKHMSLGMRKVFACPSLSNDTLKFVPVDAIAYNWGACYDLQQSWDAVKKSLGENPEIFQGAVQFKHRLERYFDMNIRRDVLPVLGGEIGGYLTDVDMQSSYPFPLPRFLIFIKIQDRAAMQALIDKFLEHPIAQLQDEDYNHVQIKYISSSLGANIDPGYCFLGDYLLVATSRQLLKRSIDAYNDSLRSIISDDVIDQFRLDNGEKFHSVTLMKTAELSRRAQDFLGWLDKYLSDRITMAAAYKQDGDNKRAELDEAIADKSAELILAQKKLNQLKNNSLANAADLDPSMVSGAIDNLNREEQLIKDDIANYIEQKSDLSRLLDNYALGAQSAKLTMYNMDNLVSPVLKGLESIDAQAVTVRFGDKILETEFLVK